jgi:hypothetical protein
VRQGWRPVGTVALSVLVPLDADLSEPIFLLILDFNDTLPIPINGNGSDSHGLLEFNGIHVMRSLVDFNHLLFLVEVLVKPILGN